MHIVHVDYGGSLQASDFASFTTFPAFITRADAFGAGETGFDVTAVFEDAFGYDASNLQQVEFVLYFDALTDGDGARDSLEIAYEDDPTTTLLPKLEVTVQNY